MHVASRFLEKLGSAKKGFTLQHEVEKGKRGLDFMLLGANEVRSRKRLEGSRPETTISGL